MGTTAAVLTLAGSLLGLIIWAVKRRAARTDAKTPADRVQDHVHTIDAEIANRAGDSAAARLDEWLRRIESQGGRGPG